MKALIILLFVCMGIASCEKAELPEQNNNKEKSIHKDLECPVITITSPTDQSNVKGTVHIQGSVTDNIGVRFIRMSDQFGNVHVWEVPEHKKWRTITLDFNYEIGLNDRILTFEAFDCAGNAATSQTLTLYFLICNTCPE